MPLCTRGHSLPPGTRQPPLGVLLRSAEPVLPLAFLPAAWLRSCLFLASSGHVAPWRCGQEKPCTHTDFTARRRPSPWAVLEGFQVGGCGRGPAQGPAAPRLLPPRAPGAVGQYRGDLVASLLAPCHLQDPVQDLRLPHEVPGTLACLLPSVSSSAPPLLANPSSSFKGAPSLPNSPGSV